MFCGKPVAYIDGVPTIIDLVRGNSYALGWIIKEDFSLEACFIAKVGGCFAHGETLKAARRAADEKYQESRPEEERIDEFVMAHPDLDAEYPDLFSWHHILTGSCEMGRKAWCDARGLKPTDSITVRAFITGTVGHYGGGTIRKLAGRYGLKTE